MAFFDSLQMYFKILPDAISGDVLIERFQDIMNTIEQTTEPMTRLDPSIGGSSNEIKSLATYLTQAGLNVSGYQQSTMKLINEMFRKVLADQDGYARLLRESFQKNNAKSRLSMEQMQLISFICSLDKASRFARCLTYIIARQEMSIPLKPKEQVYADRVLNRAEQQGFAVTMKAISIGPNNMAQLLSTLKNQVYSPEAEKIIANMNSQVKPDVLNQNRVPLLSDVVIWFGNLYTNYLKYSMDVAKEEKQRLEFVVASLQEEKAGSVTAEREQRIEQMLNTVTDQINQANAKIQSILDRSQPYDYN